MITESAAEKGRLTLQSLGITVEEIAYGSAKLDDDGNVSVALLGNLNDGGTRLKLEFTLKPWAAWEFGQWMPGRLASLHHQLVRAGLAGNAIYQAAGRARDVTPTAPPSADRP